MLVRIVCIFPSLYRCLWWAPEILPERGKKTHQQKKGKKTTIIKRKGAKDHRQNVCNTLIRVPKGKDWTHSTAAQRAKRRKTQPQPTPSGRFNRNKWMCTLQSAHGITHTHTTDRPTQPAQSFINAFGANSKLVKMDLYDISIFFPHDAVVSFSCAHSLHHSLLPLIVYYAHFVFFFAGCHC